MSEFIKKYKKWHAENNMKYDSATQYHKSLQGRFGNWRSPSDFRKLQYELNNAEMMLGLKKVAVKNLLSEKRQLREEVEKLKVDKQLVVVPKCVDEFIEEAKGDYTIYGAFTKLSTKMSRTDIGKWVFASKERQMLFARAWLDGYTVEKEKMYILKHIDMSKLYTDVSLYLAHGFCKELEHVFYKDVNVHNYDECHFTQSEIDELNIGSYEQIPVEMSDNGI